MANLDQQIFEAARGEGFSPTAAKLIVAQARLESSNYSSNVFLNNNNMFGMKFVRQPLATRGTLAPANERKCDGGCDGDYYAKYATPSDSAKDVIGRLYKKTRNGIGFEELRNVKDATEFATKLKQRNYYGFHDINTPEGKAEINKYAGGLRNRLLLINVLEVYTKYKKPINFTVLGIGLVLIGYGLYMYQRRNK